MRILFIASFTPPRRRRVHESEKNADLFCERGRSCDLKSHKHLEFRGPIHFVPTGTVFGLPARLHVQNPRTTNDRERARLATPNATECYQMRHSGWNVDTVRILTPREIAAILCELIGIHCRAACRCGSSREGEARTGVATRMASFQVAGPRRLQGRWRRSAGNWTVPGLESA